VSLDWLPVAGQPQLLAEPVRDMLAELVAAGSPLASALQVAEIDPALADTAELVEATGYDLADMANCIVIAGSRGGQERVAAALVLGHTRADVNRTVRKALDVRKCSFMPMDDAVARTGMEYGGITPLGIPPSWRLLVDARVASAGTVVIGSGVRRSKLRLTGPLLASYPDAEVVDGLATG
jgi:prolyl-tRNA editing enzyme YbaK/EbsC (Cys-tRNA(Pro) deacylase)